MEFTPFQKIGRLKRTMFVTEKIDGTNAQIVIQEQQPLPPTSAPPLLSWFDLPDDKTYNMWAGSRNRFLSLENDNFGFARWVSYNWQELAKLGPGQHFGEWWGQGIQRGYGLTEKRFSLFNTDRWLINPNRPACCRVVPLIAISEDFSCVDAALDRLRMHGSQAAPGFMSAEGVVVYHTGTRSYAKVTLNGDQAKGS